MVVSAIRATGRPPRSYTSTWTGAELSTRISEKLTSSSSLTPSPLGVKTRSTCRSPSNSPRSSASTTVVSLSTTPLASPSSTRCHEFSNAECPMEPMKSVLYPNMVASN